MDNKLITIELQGVEEMKRRIGLMITRGERPDALFRQVSGIMHHYVGENFQVGGRDPKWPESERVKKHGGQTLIDTEILVASIQEFVTATSAGVSTNDPRAAIHNFGGPITHKPYGQTTRLRTDAKGSLLRQDGHANLAVFAKKSHKRTRDSFRFSMGYTFDMPQREFMKISHGGIVQIEQAAAVFITGG